MCVLYVCGRFMKLQYLSCLSTRSVKNCNLGLSKTQKYSEVNIIVKRTTLDVILTVCEYICELAFCFYFC